MPTLNVQRTDMAPWRRVATIGLTVIAVAILVLAVAGVIHTAAIIGGLAVVAISLLVGPRSPFFKPDTA